MEYRDGMTYKEAMQYIAEAEVVWNKAEKRWATFEEIEDDWLHGSGENSTGNKMLGMSNFMGWFESAKYKNGVYGTQCVILKVDQPEGKGVPFLVTDDAPVGRDAQRLVLDSLCELSIRSSEVDR